MALIKSWANAWTTSSRMYEPVKLRCIVGCEADDNLDHYLRCDPLWTAMISTSYKRSELLWQCPMIKLGLVNPSPEWLQMIACAVACYHSLKMGHLPEVLMASDENNFSIIYSRLISYARLHLLTCLVD